MQRRAYIGVVGAAVIPLAGCSESDAPSSPEDAGDAENTQSTPDEPGLRAEHKTRLEAHGWKPSRIAGYEAKLAEEQNMSQAEIDEEVEALLTDLDNTVASVESVETELVRSGGDIYYEVVFRGIELNNTEYTRTAAHISTGEGESLPSEITENDVGSDGTFTARIDGSRFLYGETETYTYQSLKQSKHTEPIEFTIDYPDIGFEIEILKFEYSEGGFTPGVQLEFTVTNTGEMPFDPKVAVDELLIIDAVEQPIAVGETVTISKDAALWDEDADTITVEVIGGGSLGQEVQASVTLDIPK